MGGLHHHPPAYCALFSPRSWGMVISRPGKHPWYKDGESLARRLEPHSRHPKLECLKKTYFKDNVTRISIVHTIRYFRCNLISWSVLGTLKSHLGWFLWKCRMQAPNRRLANIWSTVSLQDIDTISETARQSIPSGNQLSVPKRCPVRCEQDCLFNGSTSPF